MDKSLVTRFALVCLVVALLLVATQMGWYPKLVGPIAVIAVAVIMFWPKSNDGADRGPSRSEMLKEIRDEQ